MAIGYPSPPEEGAGPECEACGSRDLVLDAVGKPVRCKACGRPVRDPFASN